MKKRKFFLISSIAIIIILSIIQFCDSRIRNDSEGKIFSDVNQIRFNKVGLLLGTGKFLADGAVNPYYLYRIEATVQLFNSGKIKYIIVSGDNSSENYDEPTTMRADLMESGIDSSRIYLDYAGFRTFDSIKRAKEVFGQNSITIISQAFHNERAIFISNKEHISAVGFNARDVSKSIGLKVQVREKFSRVKVFIDYLLGKKPKFLGPRVVIPA